MEKDFVELTNEEILEINGGINWLTYGGALLGGWAVGHAIGYTAA